LRREFFEVKQQERVFFFTVGETKESWKQQKNKKRKGLLLFFLFQVKQKANIFVFSFWSKLKKNKQQREVVAFCFSVSSKRQTFFVFSFCLSLRMILQQKIYRVEVR
jgi:hypothetical protein